MHSHGFTSSFLRSAAEKALREIQKDPKRGLSNLLGLAKVFISGHAASFEQAMRKLDEKNSVLLAIVDKLARQTDSETLINFGLNLVCRVLDKGARKIKGLEVEPDSDLPWCLSWMLDKQDGVEPARLMDLLAEALDLGIYCHVLRFGAGYAGFEQLALLPEKFPDCCFIFLVSPAMLGIPSLVRLRGRAVLLALDLDADKATLGRAVDALAAGQFLAAGQLAYHGGQSHDLQVLAEICRQQNLDLLFLIEDWQTRDWSKKSALAEQIQATRAKLERPPLIFDLWQDLADLGRLLKPGAPLAVVTGDLDLRLVDAAGTCCSFDLRQASLTSVLLNRAE